MLRQTKRHEQFCMTSSQPGVQKKEVSNISSLKAKVIVLFTLLFGVTSGIVFLQQVTKCKILIKENLPNWNK